MWKSSKRNGMVKEEVEVEVETTGINIIVDLVEEEGFNNPIIIENKMMDSREEMGSKKEIRMRDSVEEESFNNLTIEITMMDMVEVGEEVEEEAEAEVEAKDMVITIQTKTMNLMKKKLIL